ncbi:hypothetical protein OsJ_28042 [Oryza sativa Japonica Group]|nr:hypothetical protein OsJ_28042 [Oryza sativa Japonica Group]
MAEGKEETLDVTAAAEEDVEEVRPEIGASASGLRFSLSAAVAVAVKWESQVLNVPFGLEQRRWTCHSTTNSTEVALAARQRRWVARGGDLRVYDAGEEDAIFLAPAGMTHGDAQHGGLPTAMGTTDRGLAFRSGQRHR